MLSKTNWGNSKRINHERFFAEIRKNANWKKQSITSAAGINNIFNQNYQVIAFRPMPLRNYFLSFNFLLHRQTQKLKI